MISITRFLIYEEKVISCGNFSVISEIDFNGFACFYCRSLSVLSTSDWLISCLGSVLICQWVVSGLWVQLHLVIVSCYQSAYQGRSKETLLFAGYSNWKIWPTFQVMVCVLRMNSRVTSVNALAKDNFVTVNWIARIAPMNSIVVSMFKPQSNLFNQG